MFKKIDTLIRHYIDTRWPVLIRITKRVKPVGWLAAVLGVALGALGYYRNEFPNQPQPIYLGDALAMLPWYVWVLGALITILIVGFEAAYREATRLAADGGTAISDLVRIHKKEVARLNAQLYPGAITDENLQIEVVKWRCELGQDYDLLGIDCINVSSLSLGNVSVVVRALAKYIDGKWVETARIGSFREVVLGVCQDDFVGTARTATIPPGGKRRWALVFQGEHDNRATVGAADPSSRTLWIGDHSLNRMRLEIEAPPLVGVCFELFIELTTEGMAWEMNGHPQYTVVHVLKFVARTDERILEAKEIPIILTSGAYASATNAA